MLTENVAPTAAVPDSVGVGAVVKAESTADALTGPNRARNAALPTASSKNSDLKGRFGLDGFTFLVVIIRSQRRKIDHVYDAHDNADNREYPTQNDCSGRKSISALCSL